MADLIQTYNARIENSMLRNRVMAALAVQCWNMIAEDPGTTARKTWAKETLGSMESATDQFHWGAVGNAAVQAADFNPSDGDIQYIVNTMASAFAG